MLNITTNVAHTNQQTGGVRGIFAGNQGRGSITHVRSRGKVCSSYGN